MAPFGTYLWNDPRISYSSYGSIASSSVALLTIFCYLVPTGMLVTGLFVPKTFRNTNFGCFVPWTFRSHVLSKYKSCVTHVRRISNSK